jgi:AraC-like DNA-binding protein
MKPIFAKVLDGLQEQVYLTKKIERAFFSTEFHFHSECQMNYVLKSSGYKIIGDCFENFEAGELTFLGAGLPHVWHNDGIPDNDTDKEEHHALSVALFIEPERLISMLGGFYDTHQLEVVLEIAKRGMKFYGETKEQLKELLFRMSEENGLPKLLMLLQLLQILCTTKEYVLLTSAGYVNTYLGKENERIDKIFKYLFANFSNEIKLDDVAAIANMNKHAFCRFFRARTQKTLSRVVNEIRVAHAIKLMTSVEANVGNIAFDCGYNSISSFNKFFKLITKKTPSDFKRTMRGREGDKSS